MKDFVEQTKSTTIMEEEVELIFRSNDQKVHWEKINKGEPGRKLTIAQLIHEMIEAHA